MKQKLLNKLWLRVGMIVAIMTTALSGTAWAATTTYQHVFNVKPSTGDNVALSSVNWNISATQLGNYNSSNYAGVQIGTKSASGSITLTSSSAWGGQAGTYSGKTVITEVRLWLNAGTGTPVGTVTIGGVAATSDGTTVVKNSSASSYTDATMVTYTPASNGNTGVVVINVSTSSKAGYVCAMEIDCEEPGGSSLTTSDLAITNDPVALSFDLYNNASPQTVSYTTSSTGAITITPASPTSYFSYVHNASAKTITVTPLAVTPSAQTITISQAEDATYAASYKTFTVSVANSTPLANIAALTAQSSGSYSVSLTDALVTYVNGTNAYLEDASGAVLLYQCAGDLAVGDKITGTADVTYTVYNNLPEVTAFALQTGYTKTTGNTVTPAEVTIATLESNFTSYISRYVKIVGATVTSAFSNKNSTIEQSGSSIVLRDQNSSATLTTTQGSTVTVTAHPSIYSSTHQIAVYEQSQIEVAKVNPAISFNNGSVRVGATLDLSTLFTSNSTGAVTYSITAGGSYATIDGSTLTGTAEGTVTVKAAQAESTSFNAGEATATITVNPALVLSSIAVTTAPTKTAYNEGETFDPTGMVVTATYTDNSTEAVTGYTYSPDGTLTTSDTEITISYTESGVTKTTTQAITVNEVVDYATLPFAYDGNGSGTLPVGLTQSGLGTYSSSPAMKFDGTGDELILKINERPGVLSFDIKGNTFSGGTFTVQTSEDGMTYTDLETYTELGSTQSEEFSNLGENVRYIKWIYTNKSSGNVALGNINLAAYVAPANYDLSVTLSDNISAIYIFNTADENEPLITDGAAGTVQVTNGTEILVSPDVAAGYQLASLMVDGVDVTSQIDETGAYTFTMPASNVTITATAVAATPPTPSTGGKWIKTELANLTKNNIFVIVGDNGSTYAMTNDNGASSAPSTAAVTIENSSLSGAIADNIKWNLDINSEGYIFYPNGDTENWLYCTNTNNGVRVGTNTNNVFTLNGDYLYNIATTRYVGIYNSQDWRCYTTINSNIQSQTFSFYKQVESVKLNDSYGYATYASTSPLDFTDYETAGYSAWAVESISGTTITFTQITGVVPAGTGMLLMGTAGATINLNVSNTAGSAITNKLVAITSATDVTTGEYYGLSGDQFVPVNTGTVPAGKALLPASALNSNVKAFTFVFEDDATGIEETLSNSPLKGENIYNLAGQMVNGKSVNGKLPKGIYIVNGKKVLK